MSLSRNTIIVLSILVLFLIGAAIALVRLGYLGEREAVTEYRSSEYAFSYPVKYDLKEYRDGSTAIGIGSGDGFDSTVAVSVVESEESAITTPFDTIEAFLTSQAKLLCAADGPGESLSCSTVESVTPFTNEQGVFAFELYLTLDHTVLGGETTSTTFGPVFAFPISPNGDDAYAGILVYPPLTAFALDEAPGDVARRIAASLTRVR
ncbi:MAG TPA: hypothetical protein VHO23_02780 [Candidatus Paceibacterota bacterium]|nr:hypothetical protein [Candidatus Paceibacterota bacterium]